MKNKTLTHQIIGAAYEVHNTLGFGFLEKVYENAMVIELRKRGLHAEQQIPITVFYDEKIVGDFKADLLVEKQIIVELKAVTQIIPEHEVQLVNYLTATKKEFGLLINFGSSVEVKRKFREYRPGGQKL